jgi:hypothetical protein
MKKKNVVKNSKASFEKFAGKLKMDKKLLSNVGGGYPGEGFFSTISGDCNGTGESCWKWLY